MAQRLRRWANPAQVPRAASVGCWTQAVSGGHTLRPPCRRRVEVVADNAHPLCFCPIKQALARIHCDSWILVEARVPPGLATQKAGVPTASPMSSA